MKVMVEIEVPDDKSNLTREEMLEFIKKHMGHYSEYDLAKVLRVTQLGNKCLCQRCMSAQFNV